MRRLLLTFSLAAGVLGAGVTAHAATWLCGLSDDATRLVCVAEPDLAPASAAPALTAVVHGTRFPLDAEQTWTVDFWSPATDLEHVETLARSTICYRSPGCKVVFAHLPRQTLIAAR